MKKMVKALALIVFAGSVMTCCIAEEATEKPPVEEQEEVVEVTE